MTVPGADVARSVMPLNGDSVAVRSSLERSETRDLPAPLVVLGYERPWYLVRVRGTDTGWVHEDGTRLVQPVRKPATP